MMMTDTQKKALRTYVLFVQSKLAAVTYKDVLADAMKARKDDNLTQSEFELVVENKKSIADGYNEFVEAYTGEVSAYKSFMKQIGINV